MKEPNKVYLQSIISLGAEDPDFKAFLSPIEARRMGRLLKRALWTSREALKQAGVSSPDAIITATDYGCVDNSYEFLKALLSVDDSPIRPVHFMQSTHNTIGSLIGIHLHCHGYNTTYSHRGASLETALMDAWMQISSGDITSALVGWFDEDIPGFSNALRINGFCCKDRAISMVLTNHEGPLNQEIIPPFNSKDYDR